MGGDVLSRNSQKRSTMRNPQMQTAHEAHAQLALIFITFWCAVICIWSYQSFKHAASPRLAAIMLRTQAGLSPLPSERLLLPTVEEETVKNDVPPPVPIPVTAGQPFSANRQPTRPVILSIEGIIGAGKSTFLRTMQRELGMRVHIVQEKVELWRALPDPHDAARTHNLLDQYYKDAAKLAMPFQTLTIATHVNALADALHAVESLPKHERPHIVLVERSARGNACFAHMLHEDGVIDNAWYAAYTYMRTLYARFVPDVDGVVDLHVDVDTAMDRLHERARGEEVGVTTAYQTHLSRTIQGWLDTEVCPVLTLTECECSNSHIDAVKAAALATRIAEFADVCLRARAAM